MGYAGNTIKEKLHEKNEAEDHELTDGQLKELELREAAHTSENAKGYNLAEFKKTMSLMYRY